jgi:hypothetical protein
MVVFPDAAVVELVPNFVNGDMIVDTHQPSDSEADDVEARGKTITWISGEDTMLLISAPPNMQLPAY